MNERFEIRPAWRPFLPLSFVRMLSRLRETTTQTRHDRQPPEAYTSKHGLTFPHCARGPGSHDPGL